MTPELLLLGFSIAIILAALLWVFQAPGRRFLSLIPGIIPSVSLGLILFFVSQNGANEIAFPFLKILGGINLEIRFALDSLHLGLAFLACFLAFLIQLYSVSYLEKEDNHAFFHFLIVLFQAAMLGLFLSLSFFSLFIFWELVGIISYLLVQFWYRKEDVLASAFRVIMVNKAGDIALLSGIGLLMSFGLMIPVTDKILFPEGSGVFLASPTGQVICSFFVVSALIKSAQFPFSVWLKRAMAGPASVSALLHSATMVAAGVWLISRISPWLPIPVLNALAIIGILSFLAGNLAALASQQLKSILAFSTMAQLGLMVAGIGLSGSDAAILHLICHAFFKASLFLICGILMKHLSEQGSHNSDFLSELEGSLNGSLWGRFSLGLCLAALAGLPLSSGFISKHSIMPEPWISSAGNFEWTCWLLLQVGSVLTAMYSVRVFLRLSSKREGAANVPFKPLMAIPVILLSLGSGFWLFGLNPISSEGWLTGFLGIKGHAMFPDFFAPVIGLILGWILWKKKFEIRLPGFLQSTFLEFNPAEKFMNAFGGFAMNLAGLSRKTDDKILDRSLRIGAKSVVVAGYFSSFTDRYILDGIFKSIGLFFYWIGGVLFGQARHSARFAAWFILLVLIVLIYFSYYR